MLSLSTKGMLCLGNGPLALSTRGMFCIPAGVGAVPTPPVPEELTGAIRVLSLSGDLSRPNGDDADARQKTGAIKLINHLIGDVEELP